MESVGNIVKKLLKDIGLEERLKEERLKASWKELVGERIAFHAEPTRLSNGTLSINVDNPVWLYYLSTEFKGEIKNVVNQYFNEDLIKLINFYIA